MRTPHSHLHGYGPGGTTEVDLYRCAHCQGMVEVKGTKGWCHKCCAVVCGRCAKKGVCEPWEAKLEAAERRQRMLDQMGIPSR